MITVQAQLSVALPRTSGAVIAQPVEAHRNLRSGHTLEFGRTYVSGMYLVEAIPGTARKVIKVMKQ